MRRMRYYFLPSYLCIRGFLTPDETKGLLDRAKQLLDEFDINDHPKVRTVVHRNVQVSTAAFRLSYPSFLPTYRCYCDAVYVTV